MTHEPIRVIHFSPHITWQGTQAELDAMLAEGWPVGSASEIIAACKRDAAEAEAYAAKLEAKLAKAVEGLESIVDDCHPRFLVTRLDIRDAAQRTLAELKGEIDE